MGLEHLRHGLFLPPHHPVDESPQWLFQRDFELMQVADRLGFCEAWIGEHHSQGYETIASPELFIATAAERTKHIKFGTGVISLPYHNPLMVANRLLQLDHQTQGRVMFGAGPGLLASDAHMLGIEPNDTRDMMVESLEVIIRLLRGEWVTKKTDWFVLQDAHTHLLSYNHPHPEIFVASSFSPSGGRLAGRLGLKMLCMAAANANSEFDPVGANWKIATELAAEHGHQMDPRDLRLVIPMHLAESRDQAFDEVGYGFERWMAWLNNGEPRFFPPEGTDPARWWVDERRGVIGTPEDAIEMIEWLQGHHEFGVLLLLSSDWADWDATKHSLELYARKVMPYFRNANVNRQRSYDWSSENRDEFSTKRKEAYMAAIRKHEEEEAAKAAAKSNQGTQ